MGDFLVNEICSGVLYVCTKWCCCCSLSLIVVRLVTQLPHVEAFSRPALIPLPDNSVYNNVYEAKVCAVYDCMVFVQLFFFVRQLPATLHLPSTTLAIHS